MKTTLLLILLAMTSVAYADDLIREDYDPEPMIAGNTRVQELIEWEQNHPGEMPPLTEQEKYEFFIKKGMPLPGSGATVVGNTKNLKINNLQNATISKFNFDQKTKGYYELQNKKATMLLAMPKIAEKEYNKRKLMAFNPLDTHLYEVKNNLPMNYYYSGVPSKLAVKVIGFAPEAIFIKKGWAGAVEFFVPTFGGVCAFHEVNIELTKTAAYIPQEIATYAVNKKLTKMNVIGDKKTGFVYEIEWWDQRFKRTLECATKDYSETMRIKTLELAKEIDNQ